MYTPAKGASLEIGFEGSNPSLHAKYMEVAQQVELYVSRRERVKSEDFISVSSNLTFHTKCFHSIVDSTAVYGTAELSSSLSGNTKCENQVSPPFGLPVTASYMCRQGSGLTPRAATSVRREFESHPTLQKLKLIIFIDF